MGTEGRTEETTKPRKECVVDALVRIADEKHYNLTTHDSLILYRLSSAIRAAENSTI